MSGPTLRLPGQPDQPDPTIRRSWWLLAGTFSLLGLTLTVRLLTDGAGTLDWFALGLVVLAGTAAIRHRDATAALEAGRRTEAESFARILHGLSRSVSPDAMVAAIVEELAGSTGADHIVVARRRPGTAVLETTLVTRRPGVPASSILLPAADLDEPFERDDPAGEPALVAIPVGDAVVAAAAVAGPAVASPAAAPGAPVRRSIRPHARRIETGDGGPRDGATRVAERIAARVGRAYGLRSMVAAPLTDDGAVIGAIVLSRRGPEPWPATAGRILRVAAAEASAALARVSSLRAAETEAATDALTGLPNRRYFDEFCGLLARRRRADDALGVLMIDVDRFKALNDRHGHGAGDAVLRAVGGAIVGAVREDDVPARFGGEEFVVLLRNPGEAVAREIGERVRSSVAALDLRALDVPAVTVSVGVAVARAPDEPVDRLVERADRALYRAKRAGRDRVVAA